MFIIEISFEFSPLGPFTIPSNYGKRTGKEVTKNTEKEVHCKQVIMINRDKI